MDSTLWFLVVLFGAVAVVGVWWTKTYNRLVRLQNRAAAMWAEIDVELKRRHDLVPNLVSVVAGYATHERATLDEVTEARNRAIAAQRPSDQAKAENLLTASLGHLFANVENYPQLKAEPAFQELQEQLARLEQTIAQARQAYNLTVQAFNNGIETVPGNIVAWFGSMEELEYLGAEDGDRAVPEVQLRIPPAATQQS